jgi:hydroxymethylpyrimidine/phosphomethylpyrimidine kinase
VPLGVVAAQLDAVLRDLAPTVVKTGMLGTADVAGLVARRCAGLPLVVDPVLRATTGAELAGPELVEAYRSQLLPVATVVTPNAAEARVLLRRAAHDATPARDLAVALAEVLAGPAVLLTGGPEADTTAACTDWLVRPGREALALEHPAVATTNDHGTGCTHASALAAYLARGHDLESAATSAAAYMTAQLTASRTWQLGRGRGPVAHTSSIAHPTNHCTPHTPVPLTEEIA